jgi:AAA domain, putative AbiEii toxin, Type IV TA system/AAA ATPase domain
MALILDSLEIHNFRGLKELCIDRLGRVNLLTGKNNVGKTSVLEALRLYAYPGSLEVLIDLLRSRDHYAADLRSGNRGGHLFSLLLVHRESLLHSILPVPRDNRIPTIRIGRKGLPEGSVTISHSSFLEVSPTGVLGPHLLFQMADRKIPLPLANFSALGLLQYYEMASRAGMQPPEMVAVSQYVPAVGLGTAQIGEHWDRVALTPLEDEVINALRLVEPGVQRLILKPIEAESEDRVPFVKMQGDAGPVSLRSLGDGMNRLFGLALALVNAKDGFLLIDEVENGLHYSIQPDLWRLVFEASKQMNVQVFATTHSYDCIKAFDEAARGSEEEGVVIRLAQKAGRIVVGEFDERELGIAVEGQIEVR